MCIQGDLKVLVVCSFDIDSLSLSIQVNTLTYLVLIFTRYAGYLFPTRSRCVICYA